MGTRVRENLLYGALRLIRALDRRQPDASELGSDKIRRILLVSSTAIGDTLLSTPAFRSIRLAYPQARISLLVNAAYEELFSGNPDIDETIPFHGGYRRFFRLALALWRRRLDLVCILHGNEPQATPLAYLSGARFIFKLPNTNRFRFLLSNQEAIKNWDDFGHGIDQRLAVAALARGVPTDRRMTLPVLAPDETAVTALLAEKHIDARMQIIGLQPGASTLSRRWAPQRFAALARNLLSAHPTAAIVLTGSPAERALCERIADEIGSPRVWISAGELPLSLQPALLKRCSAFVTGDTGPMHMAIAVDTPVVALFAVSDHRRSGPAYDLERHVVIQKWRTCAPCLSKRCPYAQPICMDNISVDEVLSSVESRLTPPRPGIQEMPT